MISWVLFGDLVFGAFQGSESTVAPKSFHIKVTTKAAFTLTSLAGALFEASAFAMSKRDGNSDSSYDIVPAAKHLRRHPRAPTTVQVVADDFDAITQDVDFETAGAELYPFDGVTEVRTLRECRGGLEEESEPRFSGVYGEWAEKREVNYRQVPSATEYGRYMDEVSRRLQEMAVDRSSHGPSTGNRLRRDQDPTPTQQSGAGEPGRRVHMWLEEVARNGGGPSELGESTAQESSPGQRSCSRGYSTETGTLDYGAEYQDNPSSKPVKYITIIPVREGIHSLGVEPNSPTHGSTTNEHKA